MNRILLLTYHPLLAINGGTFTYKAIIEQFRREELIWVGTGAASTKSPEWMSGYKTYIFPLFIFRTNWLRIFTKPPFYLVHYLLLYLYYAPNVCLKIIKIIRSEEVSLVWIEGVKQTFIIGRMLSKLTKIPIHLSLNDDYSAQTTAIERFFFLKTPFQYLLNNSKSIDFISEGMAEYYKDRYGYSKSNYKIIWIGNKIERLPEPVINRELRRIILFGNIHGIDAVHSFCKAIQLLRNQGRSICLDIYSGANYSFLENQYKNVGYKGKVSVSELKSIIQKYDLVYVPLFFSKKGRVVATTSLPSKMILALQCQIPILAHGPCYASNIQFVKKHSVGSCITTNIPKEIAEELIKIGYGDRLSSSNNERIIYFEEYDTEKRVREFIEYLRISAVNDWDPCRI